MSKILRHSVSGDEVVVLVGTEDSHGELFRFEYVARIASTPPPDHVHRRQEERVEVLEGTISCRLDGKEHVLNAGESLTIPPGVSHAVWSSDPSGSRSIGEYRPALDMERILERAFSGM